MSVLIGLTGSIGMGKTTTAAVFENLGCFIWNADAAVHRLYEKGGAAVGPIAEVFPDAIVDGAVSREGLKSIIAGDTSALAAIESIVHPLTSEDRARFIAAHPADILVFDVPLLFETGLDEAMDRTVVASVAPEIQKERVMARGTMSEAEFERILSKQMPDVRKRQLANYVVITDSPENAAKRVKKILVDIRKSFKDA